MVVNFWVRELTVVDSERRWLMVERSRARGDGERGVE